MTTNLEVRARLYNTYYKQDETENGILVSDKGTCYVLSLPQEIQEDGVRKLHACAILQQSIDTAERNNVCLEEIVLKIGGNKK